MVTANIVNEIEYVIACGPGAQKIGADRWA